MHAAPRTLIVLMYLAALVLHGRWTTTTVLLAVAVLAVGAAPALRDARRGRAPVPASAG